MGLSQEWTALIVGVLAYLVALLPVAYQLAKTYLLAKQNAIKLQDVPTHDQVAAAIDAKIAQLPNGGTDDVSGHSASEPTPGIVTPGGSPG